MTTQAIRDAMSLVVDGGLDPCELQFFDISNAMDDHAFYDPLIQCRPPFDKCLVVYRGPSRNHAAYDMMMFVNGTDPEEGIVVTLWKGPYGQRPTHYPMLVYIVDGDMVRYGPADENEQMEEDVAKAILGLLSKWYESLSRPCELHTLTLPQTFTNRRKIAMGKTPTYDWHTVTIGPKQSKSESQGGSHASPRLHDRRGHLRRLRNGKNVWVLPCKVGNAALGTVFHDYEVAA
jgi:hypothetical protein